MFFSFKKIDQSESSLKNKMQNGGPLLRFLKIWDRSRRQTDLKIYFIFDSQEEYHSENSKELRTLPSVSFGGQKVKNS